MESALWGLIGTVVGALASLLTTHLTFKNQAWLHRQSIAEDRHAKRSSFQKKVLLELQDVIHDLMRLIAQGHFEDVKAHRDGGDWGHNYLSKDVSEGQRLSRRKLVILIERVADDNLRIALKEVNRLLAVDVISESEREADAHIQRSAHQVLLLMEHIGRVLRAQY